MKLPQIVTAAELAELAAPTDTVAMRVAIRRVSGSGPFRLRGKKQMYIAQFNQQCRMHVIDVPLSVWMADVPTGQYRDNPGIAHDLQGNRSPNLSPLLFFIVPYKAAGVVPISADSENPGTSRILDALRTLAEALGAPPLLREAFELADSGKPVDEIVKGLLDTAEAAAVASDAEHTPEDIDAEKHTAPPKDTAAAERMRKLRAAKKEKAASESLM